MERRKNIVLIGGSKGIGLATVKMLSNDHDLFVLSRTNTNFEDLNISFRKFDVITDSMDEQVFPEIIDGLVYFPGSINLRPFHMLRPDIFEADMQLNFFPLIKIIQHLLPKLKRSEGASLIFFSSVAVKVGMPFHTSVSAAKGAIEGFSKALAAELAPGIRVNVIAPSLTNTSLAGKLLSSEEKIIKMGERHPMKRVGEAEDIANMVVFLLSEKSSWMTGQVLGVDGGLSGLNIN